MHFDVAVEQFDLYRVAPKRPTMSSFGIPTIPDPPKLRRTDSDEVNVKTMIAWYRAAVSRAYGVRSMAYRNGDVTRSKHYAKLVECAHALIEHSIAPAAWAMFSIDCARQFARSQADRGEKVRAPGGGVKAPPLSWVFNASRVEAHCEWFAEVATDYRKPTALYTPALRDLIEAHAKLCEDFRRRVHDEYTARQVIAEHFPRGRYEALWARARVESARALAEYERRIASFEYVW